MSRKDYVAMAKILGNHTASDSLVVDFIDFLAKDIVFDDYYLDGCFRMRKDNSR